MKDAFIVEMNSKYYRVYRIGIYSVVVLITTFPRTYCIYV